MDYLKKFYSNIKGSKKIRRWLFVFLMTASFFFGIYVNTILGRKTEPSLSLTQQIILIFGGFFSFVTLLAVIIEKILSIEINSKKLELTELELKERDPKAIGKEIVRHFDPKFSEQLDISMLSTPFRERTSDFHDEKGAIAEILINLLEKRVTFLKERYQNKKIEIIVDAGTTFVSFFTELGYKASTKKDYWTKDILFLTNNIHGLHKLCRYNRDFVIKDVNESNQGIINNTPIVCKVLPGIADSPFQAIVSDETLDYLVKYKKDKVYRICLTTGHYVLSSVNSPQHVKTIARTEIHPRVKSAMMETSDEIYIVAPLGKVLTTVDINTTIDRLLEEFNTKHGYIENIKIPEREAYKFVKSNSLEERQESKSPELQYEAKAVLVTTRRSNHKNNLLYNHSKYIQDNLKSFNEEKIDKQSFDGPYIYSDEFNVNPNYKSMELEIEIPNKKLREAKDLFFYGVNTNQ